MDRQQLQRGDAQPPQVVDHPGMAERGVGAALVGGHELEQLGQALDVRLVHHRLAPGGARAAVAGPVEPVLNHHRLGHRARAVAPIERQVAAARIDLVAVQRVRPADAANHLLGIGVEQQLVGVEPVPLLRLVRPVRAIAVNEAGVRVRQVAVPHFVRPLRQEPPLQLAPPLAVEDAQLHRGRVRGEDGEVHPVPVGGRAEREGRSGLQPVGQCHGLGYP